MPVLLATDPNTDMGRIAEAEGFGLWSLNGNLDTFMAHLDSLASDRARIPAMGARASAFLLANYTVARIAPRILPSFA